MGGGVALTLAARHPERVQRLVAVARRSIRVRELPPLAQAGALARCRRAPVEARCGPTRERSPAPVAAVSVRDGRMPRRRVVDYFWARFNRAGGREASLRLPAQAADHGSPRTTAIPAACARRRCSCGATRIGWCRSRTAGACRAPSPARGSTWCRRAGHTPFIERPDEFLRHRAPVPRRAGVAAGRDADSAATRAQRRGSVSVMRRTLKILIVEDSPAMRQLLVLAVRKRARRRGAGGGRRSGRAQAARRMRTSI